MSNPVTGSDTAPAGSKIAVNRRPLARRVDSLSARNAGPGALCGGLMLASLAQPIRAQGAGSSVSVRDMSGWLQQADFSYSGLLVAMIVAIVVVAMAAIGSGLASAKTRRRTLWIATLSAFLSSFAALLIGQWTVSKFCVLSALGGICALAGIVLEHRRQRFPAQ